MRIYVASGLDNASKPEFQQLLSDLKHLGHTTTYDWWVHGSMRDHDNSVIEQTAERELRGVSGADLVIAFLPGGGGTHIEIGYALGMGIPVLLMNFNPETDRKVCFYYLFRMVTWWDDWVNTGSSDALAYNISRAMEISMMLWGCPVGVEIFNASCKESISTGFGRDEIFMLSAPRPQTDPRPQTELWAKHLADCQVCRKFHFQEPHLQENGS